MRTIFASSAAARPRGAAKPRSPSSGNASASTSPTTGSHSTSYSSTRVTINANKAKFGPDCLELTLQDFVKAAGQDSHGSPWSNKTPKSNASLSSGNSRNVYDEYAYKSTDDFFQNMPRIDESFFEACQLASPKRVRPVEHGMVDTSLDTTITPDTSQLSTPRHLQRRRSFGSQSADSSRGASQPPAPPSPLRRRHNGLTLTKPPSPSVSPSPPLPLAPAVSPKSVLENIRWRAERRKEILRANHFPASTDTDVPEMVVQRPKRGKQTTLAASSSTTTATTTPRFRSVSPPSVMSSFSVSTLEGRRTASASPNTTSTPTFPVELMPPPQPRKPTTSVASTTIHSNAALAYWQDRITERRQRYGSDSVSVARAWMDMGHAQTSLRDYESAVTSFATAVRLFRQKQKADSVSSAHELALAAALHHQGTATSRAKCRDKSYQVQALTLLQQALHARLSALGEDHPDTVATRNSLAWVFYHSKRYRTASECFWYVFWKRQAIFGPRHPAVAVAATDLARTFARMELDSDAQNFYSIALEIYEQMNVPASNPTVQRLRKDLQALQERQSTI